MRPRRVAAASGSTLVAGDGPGTDAEVPMSADDFAYRVADPIFAPQSGSPAPRGACRMACAARLLGRFGAPGWRCCARPRRPILETDAGTATPWAELHWALRHEQVRFLDDLLLRRTRLGLLLPAGGAELLPRLEPIAREALGWSAGEWRDQCDRYARIIDQCYQVPTP